MRKIIKKWLSLLLSLMLIIGVMPFGTVTAYAANAATEAALVKAVSKGGDVKLTKDIALTDVLRIPADVTVTLDLNGKTLDRGLKKCVDLGSVIRVEPGGTLTVKDGSDTNAGLITGGASWNGGGICNHGTLTVEGGTISGNKSLHNTYGGGGGIYNGSYKGSKATLTLKGGVITYNEARNGGGIYNSDGTLVIKDGVSVRKVGSKSYETKTVPVITGNKASAKGSGVYNAGNMHIEGEIKLDGNKNNDDVYLTSGKKIDCGKMAQKKPFGIACESYYDAITVGFASNNSEKPENYFFSAVPGIRLLYYSDRNPELCLLKNSNTSVEVYENGKLVHSTLYTDPEGAWTFAKEHAKANARSGNPARVQDDCVVVFSLGKNWTEDKQLTVDTAQNIVIDLNGHYILRNRNASKTKNGNIISVGNNAKLTIKDSNPNASGYDGRKGGVLAGGAGNDCGGGIILWNNAELYMEGGTIYKCTTNFHGGGILAKDSGSAVISLKNCFIDSCQTNTSSDNCNGGGIYISQASSVTMENVTIKNCYSEDYGGGLFIKDKPGIMTLTNCIFMNNSCMDGGGGIHFGVMNHGTEFSFEATDCLFTSNKSNNSHGGAVDIGDDDEKKGNPTVFRDCTFKNNESKGAGSALYINDNRVVLQGGTITDNYSKYMGAVYVEGNYSIGVGGKLVIKDNSADQAYRQDLVLEKGDDRSYIWDAGLEDGSYVSVSNSQNAADNRALQEVSLYQKRYFHAAYGTLSFTQTGIKTATMVTASIFGEGSTKIIIIVLVAAALAATATVIAVKKRKGGNDDYDDEDDDDEE